MRKKIQCYTNKSSDTKRFNFFAFDTETTLDGAKLLCITTYDGKESRYFSGNEDYMVQDFLDYIFEIAPYSKNNKTLIVSHFLSYDLRYILKYVIKEKKKGESDYSFGLMGLRTDTDFYAFEIIRGSDGKTIRFADTLAMFPRSLKDFAKQFGGDHKKLDGPDFDAGEQFDPDNAAHIDYAREDAIALWHSINNYADSIKKLYGVELGYTVAGTALRAWQRTIPDGVAYFRSRKDPREFFRDAFYGGLVFLTDTNQHKNVVSFDINSSYPAQMRKGVPFGTPAHTFDYLPPENSPGFFLCRVKTPEDLRVPILPYRKEDGGILWPRGGFTGTYTNIEIEFARKHGYEIEVLEGWVFEEIGFPFNDFVDLCEKIRAENKKTPFETIAKLVQNGVYGKFCTKEFRRQLFELSDDADIENAIPWGDGFFWVRTKDETETTLNKVEWGAWITANARITLLSAVYSLGVENCLYGDTDSITVKRTADFSLLPVSAAYGDWKIDKEWHDFRAIAPKCYCGFLQNQYNEWKGASKGQRARNMREENWVELFETGKTEIDTMQIRSIMNTIKTGEVSHKRLQKMSSDILKCSSFEIVGSGKVLPKRIGGMS